GSSATVSFLLSKGASPHFIGGTHDHETPLSEARYRPELMAPCLEALSLADNGFTDQFLQIKLITHEYSLGSNPAKLTSSEKTIHFDPNGTRPRVIHTLSRHKFSPIHTELAEGTGPLLEKINSFFESPLPIDTHRAISSAIQHFQNAM